MRFYNFLREARERYDRMQREEALLIYNELYQYIMKNKNNLERILIKKDIRSYKNPVWILKHEKINRERELEWWFVFIGDSIFNYGSSDIVLPIIKKTFKEIPNELPKHQKSIMHEIIHYLDDFPAGKGYYNSPEEFNAYYQEAIEDVYKDLNRRRLTVKNITDFIKIMKTKYLDKDFVQGLNSIYMRKLNKRLAELYEALKIQKLL